MFWSLDRVWLIEIWPSQVHVIVLVLTDVVLVTHLGDIWE